MGSSSDCQTLFGVRAGSSGVAQRALRYDWRMRWLVDGYNVIRRSPALASREQESLEAGRRALCALLARVSSATGDRFTIVFDGAQGGGVAAAGAVRIVFSSARESADRVLARLARDGGAVVSNDREVRQATARAGAIAITADAFLARIEAFGPALPESPAGEAWPDKDAGEDDDRPAGPRRGNPRRLPKRARAAARALGRLGRPFRG